LCSFLTFGLFFYLWLDLLLDDLFVLGAVVRGRVLLRKRLLDSGKVLCLGVFLDAVVVVALVITFSLVVLRQS
jgi:hypothetical protein